jgi:hypothetical protein
MTDREVGTQIAASFAEAGDAEAAVAALVDARVSPSCIELEHGVLAEARGREGRFVWRVLVIIVLWSIVGGLLGAAFGLLLALTVGPKGTAGLIVQMVCWIIVGHLIGGMLAGYFVLADRSQEEMPPDRPVSTLTIRGLDPRDSKRVRRLIRSRRPLQLLVTGPAAS